MRPEMRPAESLEPRPRRPWPLIVAALVLAALSGILWGQWSASRTRADQLQAELRQVYAEAESLRTRALHAEQRIAQLERELQALSARQTGAKEPPPRPTR